MRRIEGHCPPKPQLETQRHECIGLRLTAVERMCNASTTGRQRLPAGHPPHLAQVLEQQVGTFAHVQQHGQAVFFGQFELGTVHAQLAFTHGWCAQLKDKKVQPDLAHGHQARVVTMGRQLVIQQSQIVVMHV